MPLRLAQRADEVGGYGACAQLVGLVGSRVLRGRVRNGLNVWRILAIASCSVLVGDWILALGCTCVNF